jgi:hypothetical protein
MAEAPDRVELERSGGFANIKVRASVPMPDLAADERDGLDALLARPPAAEATPGMPDLHQYDLSIVVGGETHHVRLGEMEIDDRLRPLIKRLEREATS